MNTIEVGTKVITYLSAEPITWVGEPDRPGRIRRTYDLRRGGATIQCDRSMVAPADLTVPAKDDRVTVAKRTTAEARAAGHYGRSSWSYTVPGDSVEHWADTKRKATSDGARRLAILEFNSK